MQFERDMSLVDLDGSLLTQLVRRKRKSNTRLLKVAKVKAAWSDDYRAWGALACVCRALWAALRPELCLLRARVVRNLNFKIRCMQNLLVIDHDAFQRGRAHLRRPVDCRQGCNNPDALPSLLLR